MDWLLWTTIVWASIFGGAASQVVGYLMTRGEYRHWGVSRGGAHELGAYSAHVSDTPSHPGQ